MSQKFKYSVQGGWFTKRIMGRVHTQNNCLLIVVGETGTGKSALALSLAQHWDPFFNEDRIAFTAKEFLDLLPIIPSKGWIVWDEVGVYLSHRKWQSEANIQIMQVLQSFRYKLINVIFTLPSAVYMDIVARTMCHYLVVMGKRGVATVYRILKPTYQGSPWTKRIGVLYSEMPTMGLWEKFEKVRTQHQDKLYEEARKKSEATIEKQKQKLEKTLKGRVKDEELMHICKAILPDVVDVTKDSDQGMIKVGKLRSTLENATGTYVNLNRGYDLRKELLEYLHRDDNKILKRLREKAGAPQSDSSGGNGSA